jgi:NAD(P)-dependent dehydrogenase (short-subunit alcohol dehydrogenase family)
VRGAFAAARSRFGDAYVLVNNAGQAQSARFTETSRAMWDHLLATNLTSVYLCMQQVLPAMLAAREGRIVNIASTAALRGGTWISAYSASKHGVLGLTRSVALEAAKHGVTVNAVCPGYTDTDMTQQGIEELMRNRRVSADDALKMITRTIPRGTLIRTDEVASAVGWLCSPNATGITGQVIIVAGGDLA